MNFGEITATFEIVTPAFVAGADQQDPKLRLPEILGALRCWWRIRRAKDFGDKNGNLESVRMRAEENALFGGPADDKIGGGGQGAFLPELRIVAYPREPHTHTKKNANSSPIWVPLVDNANRKGLNASGKNPLGFELLFHFRRGKDGKNRTTQIKDLFATLKLFGLLGNLGYAERRGFGSVNLAGLEAACDDFIDDQVCIRSYSGYCNALAELLVFPAKNFQLINAPTLTRKSILAVIYLREHDPIMALGAYVEAINNAGFKQPAHSVFSNQGGRGREPSPLHVHVHRLAKDAAVCLFFMPTNNNGNGLTSPPTSYADNASGRAREFIDRTCEELLSRSPTPCLWPKNSELIAKLPSSGVAPAS